MRVAVVYASTHGHAARIAARLAETIAAEDVDLTAAEHDEELRAETRRVIDEFVEDTGWTPDAQTAVADRTAARHRDRSVRGCS